MYVHLATAMDVRRPGARRGRRLFVHDARRDSLASCRPAQRRQRRVTDAYRSGRESGDGVADQLGAEDKADDGHNGGVLAGHPVV